MVLSKIGARFGLCARREDVEFPRTGDSRNSEYLGQRSAKGRHSDGLRIGPHYIAKDRPGVARYVAIAAKEKEACPCRTF